MLRIFVTSIALLMLVTTVGCKKTLEFVPDQQPEYGRFSADYEQRDDGLLMVKLWPDDYLIAGADIMISETQAVEPVSIHYSTGLHKIITDERSEAITKIVEAGKKREKREGRRPPATFIVFRQADIGDKPWRLRLKIPGQPNPLFIMLREHAAE